MPQALEDAKILDLSPTRAIPYSRIILRDPGAETVRGAGEETRPRSLPWAGKLSAHHLRTHRQKKSIPVDLKKREELEFHRRLAQGSDLLLKIFFPGGTLGKGSRRVLGSSMSSPQPRGITGLRRPYGGNTVEGLRHVFGHIPESVA